MSYSNGEIIKKIVQYLKIQHTANDLKGHPAGFIEALANFYLDVFCDFNDFYLGK